MLSLAANNSATLTARRPSRLKNLILITALICLPIYSMGQTEQYRIVTEDWAPYNHIENGEITGIATDIVRAIMAITGDDFKISLLPSMRTRQILQKQPKTIMYSLFRTEPREASYKWVGPILEASIYPYQLAASPHPARSRQQLINAPRITTRHAGLVPELLESRGFTNLDKAAAKSVQLYRMLLAGRADIIISDTEAGVAYYSRQLAIEPGTLQQIPVEIYRSPLYIAFSRDCDDHLVEAWASAFEQLRHSGELSRIAQRYN